MKKSVRSRKWSSSLRIVSRCMLSSCTKFGGFGGTPLLLPYERDPAFDAMSARKSTSHLRDLCTIHLQQTYRCAEIQVSYTESRFTDATFHSVSNSSSSRSTPRRPIYCTNVISTCWVPIQVLGLLIRPTRSNRRCWSSLDKWHLSVVFTRLSLLNGYSRRVIRRWILGMQEPHNKLPISETNSILVGFGWEFC